MRAVRLANPKVSRFQDGQFTVDQSNSGSSKYLKYSLLYPLYLWVRAGLKTYVSDLWNVAEIMSYIFFITAFVCKVQMNFVQSEIIEDVFDELLTMNVQNGTDIAASEELLHQHQLTEGRLAVSGGQPHLSDLAIDPKSQAALAAVYGRTRSKRSSISPSSTHSHSSPTPSSCGSSCESAPFLTRVCLLCFAHMYRAHCAASSTST